MIFRILIMYVCYRYEIINYRKYRNMDILDCKLLLTQPSLTNHQKPTNPTSPLIFLHSSLTPITITNTKLTILQTIIYLIITQMFPYLDNTKPNTTKVLLIVGDLIEILILENPFKVDSSIKTYLFINLQGSPIIS